MNPDGTFYWGVYAQIMNAARAEWMDAMEPTPVLLTGIDKQFLESCGIEWREE